MQVYTSFAMEFKKFFAKRLRDIRTKKGYTQRQLAKICGLPINAIAKYETELIAPSAESLKKLAEVLEVSADYFIFDQANMQGVPKIRDPELFERYFVLETLDEEERGAALTLLDALIAKQRLRELVTAPSKMPASSEKSKNQKAASL